MRHTFAAGHSESVERARLQRKVAERRAMYESFPDHTSEVALRMAESALEQFDKQHPVGGRDFSPGEPPSSRHLPPEPAA